MPFGGVVVVTERAELKAKVSDVSNAFRRGGRGDLLATITTNSDSLSPMPFGGVVVVTGEGRTEGEGQRVSNAFRRGGRGDLQYAIYEFEAKGGLQCLSAGWSW